MSNEILKPENFVEIDKNTESFLLEKIKGLEEKVKKLEYDSMHDYLTGLHARRYLEERAEEIISSIKNKKQEKREEGYDSFSLLFCDLDNFKEVNDILGHKEGDDVLKKISEIINNKVRSADIVSRWAGDEIAVGLLGANEEEAAEIAEKIRIAVVEELKDTVATLSIGVASYEEGLDMALITERADKAMYLAKESGRNKVVKYSEISKDKPI